MPDRPVLAVRAEGDAGSRHDACAAVAAIAAAVDGVIAGHAAAVDKIGPGVRADRVEVVGLERSGGCRRGSQ
jgi:hypothetical protein